MASITMCFFRLLAELHLTSIIMKPSKTQICVSNRQGQLRAWLIVRRKSRANVIFNARRENKKHTCECVCERAIPSDHEINDLSNENGR